MRFLNALLLSIVSGLGEARRDPRHAGRAIAEKIELSERGVHHEPVNVVKNERVQHVKRATATTIPQTEAIKSLSQDSAG